MVGAVSSTAGGRSPSWLPESAPAVVLEELARHLQRWPAEPGDLLSRTSDGAPWPRNRLMEVFRRAVKAAGLPTGTTSHDLRHHYASLLIAAGCSMKSVQERLGHASAVETLQTYAHLWPDDEDRTRAAVERAWAAPAAESSLSPERAL